MSGTHSKSGLQCSHGSELDAKIPRPKMPKTGLRMTTNESKEITNYRPALLTALPPELRRKMGFQPRSDDENADSTIWTPGSGVLVATGSGRDGSFLKRRSGYAFSMQPLLLPVLKIYLLDSRLPMSERASALAQKNFIPGISMSVM